MATFICCISTLDSLRYTQAAFYSDNKFAQVFASLKRAPESLKGRIEAIEGVQTVQTRVLASVNLDVENYPHPVTGLIVSVPDHGAGALNQLHIRRGRRVDSSRDDEVIISESFADAHGFQRPEIIFTPPSTGNASACKLWE